LVGAIKSGLGSAPNGQGEVLVIPNGPDESWKAVAKVFIGDTRVSWHPIATSHPSAARNVGLSLATGKFVRFLDDDDVLLPGAIEQCISMDGTSHDVSQGGIVVRDLTGAVQETLVAVQSTDFIESVLAGRMFTLCHSFLWRRESIAGHRWNEVLHANEDVAWALELAAGVELSPHCSPLVVGAWIRHSSASISNRTTPLAHDRSKAEILLSVAARLQRRGALTRSRQAFIGTSLWNCIHNSFALSPLYWSRMAVRARSLLPGSRPDMDGLGNAPFSLFHPLATEVIMAPYRLLRHAARRSSSNP